MLLLCSLGRAMLWTQSPALCQIRWLDPEDGRFAEDPGIHIMEPAQARQWLAEATDETTYNNAGDEMEIEEEEEEEEEEEKEEDEEEEEEEKREELMRHPGFPPRYIFNKINLELVSHECAPLEKKPNNDVR